MNRLIALAILMLTTSMAEAGETYSFELGGRTIRIDKPRDCDDVSCVSISIPGVLESGPKRGKRAPIDRDDEFDDDAADAPKLGKPAQGARKPGGEPAATASKPALDPAPGAPPAAAAAPAPSRASEPAAAPTPPPAAANAPAVGDKAPAAAPVTAAVAPTPPEPSPLATAAGSPSPLGVWWTEEKEGKIRIEPCGSDLCGYSVKASNENGEKILINMKPSGDSKWKGRIHDPKSGSDYDSTIALKGSDRLRVQGCAFGGMFCGGQTWTRLN